MTCQPGSLRICLLSPWYGGSHKRWADEYRQKSRHQIEILSLPAVHWKWRMHGAAVTLANQFAGSGESFDLILAEDMMDVALFAGIIRSKGIRTPIAVYFHENQVSYPKSPRDVDTWAPKDQRYGFINYTSALVADAVYFNSRYHRDSFLGSMPDFLGQFPDHANEETIDSIAKKSFVLPLGLDLDALDGQKPEIPVSKSNEPLLLWNHRREHDKCPEVFLDILYALHESEVPFKVALLGSEYAPTRELFEKAHDTLGKRIVHDGRVHNAREYAQWLWRADILPVTSVQDFFGGSVIEAVYCGCHPVLPRRLAYPEHFPGKHVFYESVDEAVRMIERLVFSGRWRQPSLLRKETTRYSWSQVAPQYDEAFVRLCSLYQR